MVKLRLQRYGKHKRPFYRLVASDSRKPRDGKFLEILGTYDLLNGETKLEDEKIISWLSKGAQVSITVRNLLKKNKIEK